MASWNGKTRGGLTGYKIFISILKYYGLPFAYFILRFVAFWFVISSPESFSFIFGFYKKRLGFKTGRSLISVYRNYYAFGQVLLDRTALMAGFRTKFRFEFQGEEYLRKMVEDKTGGLLISAHTGNFEMAGNMLERLNAPVNIIMVDSEHEKIKEYLSSVTRRNFNVIVLKDDGSHIYEINRALNDKEIVCLHGDRIAGNGKKIKEPFLGEDAFFPEGPFYLAMKFKVPVSFVFAMKENKNSYHFYATPCKYYEQQGSVTKRNKIIREIIKEYIYNLEQIVRKYPFQWFNYYNFWESDEQ